MTENRKSSRGAWADPDEAPDLSLDPWKDRVAAAPVRRGRPQAETNKISTTIRLDADILDRFRAGGPGWQSRINAALKEWLRQQP
ncbi:MAG: BrnA antitoxin family protein [Shinella sp.]|nr:BrnA antitoxin family protein [Shinella sp.]